MKQFGKTCYKDYFYIKIDFMLQNGMEIIPVEVKAGDSIRANSLKKIYCGPETKAGMDTISLKNFSAIVLVL